jgi:hypothetical protein
MRIKLLSENLKKEERLEDLSMNGRIKDLK